ncbi:MAG TPA: Holliday junction branch migration protein RuvA [Chiayiivirga sp.]|nr:Holliday junction branch migration protein RuvA [Chiayiivirga sp.]
MIGRLKGILVHKQPPWLIVDVNGVGYELEAPMSTIYELPELGREVTVFVHHAQKEDSVALYGFLREVDRRLFRDVQKVSGIGAKSALAILSGSSAEDFARQIHAGDLAGLTRIPGIGKKTAERLILELRDKLGGLGASAQPATDSATNPIQASALDEAGIALQQLGYKPAEAARMAKLAAEPGDTAESIIRKALRAALRN